MILSAGLLSVKRLILSLLPGEPCFTWNIKAENTFVVLQQLVFCLRRFVLRGDKPASSMLRFSLKVDEMFHVKRQIKRALNRTLLRLFWAAEMIARQVEKKAHRLKHCIWTH